MNAFAKSGLHQRDQCVNGFKFFGLGGVFTVGFARKNVFKKQTVKLSQMIREFHLACGAALATNDKSGKTFESRFVTGFDVFEGGG